MTLSDIYNKQIEIADIEKELTSLKKEVAEEISKLRSVGTLEDDTFKLDIKTSTKRILDTDMFRNQFPEQFAKLFAKIGFDKFKPNKEESKNVLPDEDIDSVCSSQVSETVKVVLKK